ncbi:MAG: 1-phosphofructokinase family hexose kinase [Clostridia bacterium]|nr:1-phosphofructokinase family hexose kinase [Clostridia bacterium]
MIISVSLNPSIDKSVSIESFNYGSMNRAKDVRYDAGGKAINLAYVASMLGLDVKCVGFTRKGGEDIILKRLGDIKHDFISLPGSIRTNMKLLDLSRGTVTEVNEPGQAVDEKDLAQALDKIMSCAVEADYIVLTGSVPPGCPKSFYAEVIARCGHKCVLDAEGEALELGIRQKPYLIKPNRMELEMLVGRKLNTLREVCSAANDICARGVSVTAVSLGAEGALLTDSRQTFYAPAIKVNVKSTVGAGDSMLAGMISGLVDKAPLDEVLRRGVACASASITHEGTQLMDIDTCKSLLKEITVERM